MTSGNVYAMPCVGYITCALPCHLPSGNALVTVATGVLSEDDAERAGLVPTHAYAVLKMVDAEVCIWTVM